MGPGQDGDGSQSNIDKAAGTVNTNKLLVDNQVNADVIADFVGISNWSNAFLTVKNAGTIEGGASIYVDTNMDTLDDNWEGAAINSRGGLDLNNALTGLIMGDVSTGWFNSKITNAGTINGTIDSWFHNSEVQYTDVSNPNGRADDITVIDVDHDGIFTIAASEGVLASTLTNTFTNTGTIRGSASYGFNLIDDGGTVGDASDDIVSTFRVAFNLNNVKDSITNSGKVYGNIWMEGGNDTLTNSGTIYGHVDLSEGDDTLNNTGNLFGLNDNEGIQYQSGVNGGNGNNTIINSGVLVDGYSGGSGNDKVTNTGRIFGGLDLGDGNNEVVSNTIHIFGDINAGVGNDKITSNAGTINGNLNLGDGTNSVTSAGTIRGSINAGTGNDTVTNTGIIRGDINVGDGDNVITNSKTVYGGIFTGKAANLTATAVEKITNSGTIWGDISTGDGNRTITNSGIVDGGVFTGTGNDTLTNSREIRNDVDLGLGNNTLTNTLTGLIGGNLSAGDGNTNVKNDGVIRGDIGVGAGDHTISNTKTVYGGIFTGNATNTVIDPLKGTSKIDTITNSGTIYGDISTGGGKRTITNSGTVHGNIVTGAGADTISNSGTIRRAIDAGNGNNIITNTKSILGFYDDKATPNENDDVFFGIRVGDGNNVIKNTGGTVFNGIFLGNADAVTGNVVDNTGTVNTGVFGGSGKDTVTNSGSINGDVVLFDGADKFENKITGLVFGAVLLGNGANPDGKNTIINAGTIYDTVAGGNNDDIVTNSKLIKGDVVLAGGNDTLTNTVGTIEGDIYVGSGNDTVNGGAASEFVIEVVETAPNVFSEAEGAGADTYNLGAGDDYVLAARDTSIDTYDGGLGTKDAIDFIHASEGFTLDLKSKTLAFNTAGVTDTVKGFEIVYGSGFADIIIGDDSLAAGVAETLSGEGGADHITGGLNADKLYAGNDGFGGFDGGVDTFHYLSLNDSKNTVATRDTIYQFDDTMDVIDLSLLDADAVLAGDQNFIWLGFGGDFTNTKGELRAIQRGSFTIIEADTEGDKVADFTIALQGIHDNLSAANFLGLVF